MPKKLRIPSKVVIEQKEYDVACISNNGFRNRTFDPGSELICPSTLRQIGTYAFDSVSNLKKVVLNDGLIEIGNCFSFYGCKDLEEINIPESLTYDNIAGGSFTNCNSLKTVVVDSQSVCESTDECKDLFKYAETIYVKNTLTIKGSAYISKNYEKAVESDREDYDKYVISMFSYKDLGNDTYSVSQGKDCKGDIIIPTMHNGKSVSAVDAAAFYDNKEITSVEIDVSTLLPISFGGCTALKKVYIKSGVTNIGNCYTFMGDSLEEITLDSVNAACVTDNISALFNTGGSKVKVLNSIISEHKTDFENGYLFKNSKKGEAGDTYTTFTINSSL